jgi:hypothetical protein
MACFFLMELFAADEEGDCVIVNWHLLRGENLRQSPTAGDLRHLCSGAHPPMGACDV